MVQKRRRKRNIPALLRALGLFVPAASLVAVVVMVLGFMNYCHIDNQITLDRAIVIGGGLLSAILASLLLEAAARRTARAEARRRRPKAEAMRRAS